MILKKLNVHDLRIIRSQSFNLDSKLNIFYGDNGSGKTSVLEAINFVLTGRSFRTSNTKNLIRHDAERSTVFVEAHSSVNNQNFKIGVTRHKKNVEMVINGQKQRAFSATAKIIPLQVVDPSSFNLLESPPEFRRRFIDWSVFHVEHQFHEHWKRYKNSLKQRNTLLRRGKIKDGELLPWNHALIQHGNFINECRKKQLLELQPIVITYLKKYLRDISNVELRYTQGWDKNLTLEESLITNSTGDMDQGHTRFGPHRADIKFLVDGISANEYLSRGQQKSFHICLKLAQSDLVLSKTGKKSVFLLDDITAELDTDNVDLVFNNLNELDAQIFITSLDMLEKPKLNYLQSSCMFHVKHGQITQIAD